MWKWHTLNRTVYRQKLTEIMDAGRVSNPQDHESTTWQSDVSSQSEILERPIP